MSRLYRVSGSAARLEYSNFVAYSRTRCYFSMKFTKGQPGVSCVFTAHFLPLALITPQPLPVTRLFLTHTQTATHLGVTHVKTLRHFDTLKKKLYLKLTQSVQHFGPTNTLTLPLLGIYIQLESAAQYVDRDRIGTVARSRH